MAKVMKISEDQLESIGLNADTIDSLAAGLDLPMSASFHVEQLKKLLPDIANDLKILFRAISGENPWEDGPFDIKEYQNG